MKKLSLSNTIPGYTPELTELERQVNGDELCKASYSLTSKVLLLAAVLLLPPFFSFFFVISTFFKRKPCKFQLLLFAFTGAVLLIYFAPVWDCIAHYFRARSFLDLSPGYELPARVKFMDYYYIEYLFFLITGASQYNYFCLFIYTALLYCLGILTCNKRESYPIELLYMFAFVGIFFINGWTRFALATTSIIMLEFMPKKYIWLSLFVIFFAYQIHAASLLLLGAFPLYMLMRKRKISFGFILLGAIGVFIGKFLFLQYAAALLNMDGYIGYFESKGSWYVSDYILVPAKTMVCVFCYFIVQKYSGYVKFKWLMSLFLFSFCIMIIFFDLNTIRERITNIVLITGIVLTYPIMAQHCRKSLVDATTVIACVFALFTCFLCCRPMFFNPEFTDIPACQQIAMRIFYTPTVILLDIEKYGFYNDLFELTTWTIS